jgi:hypothetical protein
MALLAAATNYRSAAADSLLLEETFAAQQLFQEAAETYLAAGSAYGLLIANLTGAEAAERHWPLESRGHPVDVFNLWAPLPPSRDSAPLPERVDRERLEAFRTERVGVLGLPVALYLNLFDATASVASFGAVNSEALFPFLGTYSMAVQQAIHDRFHWSRMLMPFHPAEPEIMGLLMAVRRRSHGQGDDLRPVITSLPLNPTARVLLRGVLRQYGAWHSDFRM